MSTPTPPAEAPFWRTVRSFPLPYFSLQNRLARLVWGAVCALLYRPTPRPFHGWRSMVLRAFGARLSPGCHIYAGAKIWAPWNLECARGATIADGAEIYNPSLVKLGEDSIVSQGAYLCAASHDYRAPGFPLTTAPIVIEKNGWVAARAIVMMGVRIGEGCVVGAGSVVTTDMPDHAVCAGNPCRVIRENAGRQPWQPAPKTEETNSADQVKYNAKGSRGED